MPVGSSISASPPLAGDTAATAKTKLLDTLTKVVTAIEERVPVGNIDFSGANLDLAGGSIRGVGNVVYVDQAVLPDTPYSTFFSGDEFWVNTPGGAVRLTLAGALDTGTLGTIVGDYGGVDPARVIYTSAGTYYEFTSDPTTYASVLASELNLTVAVDGPTITLRGGGNGTWTFPEPPASVSLLSVDNTGLISTTNNLSIDLVVNTIRATDITYPGRIINVAPGSAYVRSGFSAPTTGTPGSATTLTVPNPAGVAYYRLGVEEGDIISAVGLRMQILTVSTGKTNVVDVVVYNPVDGTSAVPGLQSSYTTDTTLGFKDGTPSGAEVTVEAGKIYLLRLTTARTAGTTDVVINMSTTVGR